MRTNLIQKDISFVLVVLLLVLTLSPVFAFGQETTVTDTPGESEIVEEGTGDVGSGDVRVIDVDVKGNIRVEKELMMLNLSSEIGKPLDPAAVREDVKRIYKLGFFEDVRAEVERTPQGVVLTYNVKEKPVVVDLRIRGNKDIKSPDILEVIEVKEGRIIDLNKIKKSVETIDALYAEKGLVGTEVTYDIEPEGEGTVSVTFKITEGKKAYIKQVNILGNEKLKTKEVRNGIYSKPKGMFSFISGKGLYNQREIENDTERIRATYIDNGFLDAKVAKPEIVYSDEKKGYIITFRVEEGEQFTVENISFTGELLVPEEELISLLSLKSGNIFRGSFLAQDISDLTTFYGNKGYAFANVDPAFNLDRQNLTVDIRFAVEKGPEVYIRNIDIVGNTRTKDGVIRREIPIQEEQLFNASQVDAIRSRVTRLGFFEENVEVVSERVPGDEDELDLKVRVEEKSTGFFSVAGGFSSVETFIFAGQIQEANLFGTGKRVSFNAQIGGVTQLFFVNYQDPHLFDTDWTLDALIFRTDRQFRDFDRKSWGGSLTVGRRLWRQLFGTVTYRLESLDVGDIDDEARLIITREKRTISSLGVGLRWDSRNNLLDPSRGNLTRTNLEFAGVGGDTDFIKYTISSRQWVPFYLGTVFSFRGRYGLIDLRNNGNDLVVGERFFLGGPNSLRGFGFRRVGPRVPTADGDFVIIGGVQELLATADFVFPILPSAGLRGVLFFDMGNAFNDGEDLTINPADLRTDVGFGVRWVSPLGPLRLELGFPLGDRLPGENSFEIQFTVGTLF